MKDFLETVKYLSKWNIQRGGKYGNKYLKDIKQNVGKMQEIGKKHQPTSVFQEFAEKTQEKFPEFKRTRSKLKRPTKCPGK